MHSATLDQARAILQQRFGYLLTNDMDDTLYLATTDGFFFAMKEKNPKPYR